MQGKKVFFPNLDGLRFLCFLMVFLFHSFHTDNQTILDNSLYQFIASDLFGNGNLGVNFFFVLSGFLITYLLLVEFKLNKRVDVPRFWIRRILRIWPLYYFCVAFGFLLFPILKSFAGEVPNETASWLHYVLFASNFDVIRSGLPDASILGVLWSVAVEEQFYLVWPVLVGALLPRKALIFFLPLIVLGTLAFRATHLQAIVLEMHTFSCIGDMAIGGIGAWFVFRKDEFRTKIEDASKISTAALYLIFLTIYFFRWEIFGSHTVLTIIERPIIAAVMLGIILEQNFAKNSLFKLGKFKTLSSWGRISYGLYCYHFFGILATLTLTSKLGLNDSLGGVLILETSIALLITIVMSHLSFRFLETPFLKLKSRFSYITTGQKIG